MSIVRANFGEGLLAEETMWQVLVLIPRGNWAHQGIVIVEVMWKVVTAILNNQLTASITFHELLHGFWSGRGTGNANLEAKLIHQLASLREEVL